MTFKERVHLLVAPCKSLPLEVTVADIAPYLVSLLNGDDPTWSHVPTGWSYVPTGGNGGYCSSIALAAV